MTTCDGDCNDFEPLIHIGAAQLDSVTECMADFDGDGDLDLIVLNRGINVLLLNDGKGHLALQLGAFGAVSWETVGASVGDLNGDEVLDIVTANRQLFLEQPGVELGDPNQLLLGDKVGFTYASEWFPKGTTTGYTFLSSMIDIDGDGWLDIYILNDFIGMLGNIMLHNNGGTDEPLTDISVETFTGLQVESMGMGIGDVNGDQIPDFVISNLFDPPLLESLGDNTWVQTKEVRELSTAVSGTDDAHYATWAIEFADMDNDRDLDVPAVSGSIMGPTTPDNPPNQRDFMFLREGDVFVDVAAAWAVDSTENHWGMVVADMNYDGWLDLVKRHINGLPTVHYSRCGDNAWSIISLRDQGPNTRAIGATVELFSDNDSQIRWVMAGSTSLSSSGPYELHFGLGDAQSIDAVRITWPDGAESVFKDLALNQRLNDHGKTR